MGTLIPAAGIGSVTLEGGAELARSEPDSDKRYMPWKKTTNR